MARRIALLALCFSLSLFAARPLEVVYSDNGYGNTDTSFNLVAYVTDRGIIQTKDLYAIVQYAELAKSAEINQMPIQRITVGSMPVIKVPYISLKIDRLKPTTMYRARVTVYRKEGSSFVALDTTPYFYTTTAGSDPKSLVRTRMILKGLKEFDLSEKGQVGQNGTKFKDGTKYGADLGEKWCSEFYAWVGAASGLKGVAGLTSVARLTSYFTKHKGMEDPSQIPAMARRGDYVSMDTDKNGDANHSGMFLAFDRDDEGDFIWTLEGNSGNRIKVHRRPFDRVFKGLGHIMHSQI